MQVSEKLFGRPTKRPTYAPDNRLVDSTTLVGVEVEGEGRRMQTVRANLSPFWRVERDGSLRNNGFEAVLEHPLAGQSLIEAVEELSPGLRGASFSFRTSVHVHVDVADMDTAALNRFLFYYTILEKDLFDWIGYEREQNPYCVPFFRQSNIIWSLMEAVEDRYNDLVNEERYSAVNCSAIAKYTSLEFRHMYGTRDTNTILTWINIILAMKKAAVEGVYEVGYTVLQDVSEKGYEEFVESILGDMAPHIIMENTTINIMDGARMAQHFVALDSEKVEALRGLANETEATAEQAVQSFIYYHS